VHRFRESLLGKIPFLPHRDQALREPFSVSIVRDLLLTFHVVSIGIEI
jgi:hypothetical protein